MVERSIAASSLDSGAFALHLPICMEELLMGLEDTETSEPSWSLQLRKMKIDHSEIKFLF